MTSRSYAFLILALSFAACSAQKDMSIFGQANDIHSGIVSKGNELPYTNIKVMEDGNFEVTCKNGTSETISSLDDLKNGIICTKPLADKSSALVALRKNQFCYLNKETGSVKCWGEYKPEIKLDGPAEALGGDGLNIVCAISQSKLRCSEGDGQNYLSKLKDVPASFPHARALAIVGSGICILDPVLKCWGADERFMNFAKLAPLGLKLQYSAGHLYVLTPKGVVTTDEKFALNEKAVDFAVGQPGICIITEFNSVKCSFDPKYYISDFQMTEKLLGVGNSTEKLLEIAVSNYFVCARTDKTVRCVHIHSPSVKLSIPALKNPTSLYAGAGNTSGEDAFCSETVDGIICWGSKLTNSLKRKTKYSDISIAKQRSLCTLSDLGLECWGTSKPGYGSNPPAGITTTGPSLNNPELMATDKLGEIAIFCTTDQSKILCWNDNSKKRLVISHSFKQKINVLVARLDGDKFSPEIKVCASSLEGLACGIFSSETEIGEIKFIKDSQPIVKGFVPPFADNLFLSQGGHLLKVDWSTFSAQIFDGYNGVEKIDYEQGPLENYFGDLGYIQNNQLKAVRYSDGRIGPTLFLEGNKDILDLKQFDKTYLVLKKDNTVEIWKSSDGDKPPYILTQTISDVKKMEVGYSYACLLKQSGYVECVGDIREINGFNGLEETLALPHSTTESK